MYRIVKRIVHTITTVTWLVRLGDDPVLGTPVEKEIHFPASYSVTEEEVSESNPLSKHVSEQSQPTLDQGEKS